MEQSFYEVLEVDPRASTTDIKNAKRAALLKYHPDKQVTDTPLAADVEAEAKAKFHAILQASEVLLDAKKRQEYDTQTLVLLTLQAFSNAQEVPFRENFTEHVAQTLKPLFRLMSKVLLEGARATVTVDRASVSTIFPPTGYLDLPVHACGIVVRLLNPCSQQQWQAWHQQWQQPQWSWQPTMGPMVPMFGMTVNPLYQVPFMGHPSASTQQAFPAQPRGHSVAKAKPAKAQPAANPAAKPAAAKPPAHKATTTSPFGPKPFKCTHRRCTAAFSTAVELTQHMEVFVHDDAEPLAPDATKPGVPGGRNVRVTLRPKEKADRREALQEESRRIAQERQRLSDAEAVRKKLGNLLPEGNEE
eukprot:EG_transcript_16690